VFLTISKLAANRFHRAPIQRVPKKAKGWNVLAKVKGLMGRKKKNRWKSQLWK